ncbi:MAG TPA: response regulator [bacterium]|nr:response regulator [bacterium]
MADDIREPGAGSDAAPAGESARGGNLRAEVLARMGHELRTPLNAIIGFIKLVEEGLYTTDEERQDYLANARQSALTLLDLINNILDLARIEAGRLSLESVELNPTELVEGIAKTLAPEAHAKGVDIDAFVDPAIPARLRSDPLRLRQVLYNLAGNAVKFTDEGLVLLRAELEANEHDASRVRFTVSDTGMGVPQELQASIFESFVQKRLPHSDRLGGVGLGLSISKQIVEQMGSSISMKSRLNAGSTFWFTLTLPRGKAYGSRTRGRNADLHGAPVLLVNPDEATRELYVAKLGTIGAQAQGVADTDAALALLAGAQTGPAPMRVVVIDPHLRRDDALVFARRLRREKAWFQPDLVYLSIIGSAGDAALLRDAGVTAFVTKPATPVALRGALAALLERQGPHGVPLAATAGEAEAGPTAPTRIGTARVLVAEDNAVNQKLIHALLSKHGYETHMVGNGREAVEAVKRGPFDLVLMDVQMPVLDGLAATRAIRERPGSRTLPIIAMTADALDGDRERCLAAGMDDYLPKPIMPDVLHRKLSKWLQRPLPAGVPAPDEEDAALHEPLLNLEHLDAVRAYAWDHDPQRFAQLLAIFRAEAGAALEALGRPDVLADRAALRTAAQRLAGACAGFGAPRLMMLAREAAERADSTEPATLEALLRHLQTAFRGVEAALADRFGPDGESPPAA